jgi:methionine-rich copper-binding protein CopC
MNRRRGLTIVLALALSLLFLTVAAAHAELVSSNPAAGARLAAAPAKVTLVFSEEISDNASDSSFTVADVSGKTVGTGKLDTNDLDHKTMSGALDAGLADGVYTVAWNALTPDDNGHSEGSFTFGINADPGTQPTAEEHGDATPTAAATTAAVPAATTRPAATATPAATAAPAGGAPSTLPRTAEAGSGMGAYLLLGGLALLAAGVALRRTWARMR